MVPCLLLLGMMRGTWIVGALAMLGGCSGGGDDQVNPDGRPDATGMGGLTVRFIATESPLPLAPADDRTLVEVRLQAGSVRAIGDAAPGDAQTTRTDYEMDWHESDAPSAITFNSAPIGLYSSVEVRLEGEGGDDDGFRIEGQTLREAVWQPYRIVGNDPLTITIPTSTPLEIGSTATIRIDVDLAAMITGINFSEWPFENGSVQVDGDTAAIRAAVTEAFSSVTGDGAQPQ
jgi:hypothetical protein